jgi:Integrase core domain
MTRMLVSQDELVSIINTALKSSDLLDGDCRQCYVRGFYRLAEPDEEGCNWELHHYSGLRNVRSSSWKSKSIGLRPHLFRGNTFAEDSQMQAVLRSYIPSYNRSRMHPSLNYVSPATYENQLA